LKGINLEVPRGSVFGLLGTNGAGKTTLIRTLLGLIPASGGEVRVLGEEPYQIGPTLRQRIGYVSEEQGLYGWMTIVEMIRFCRSLYPTWDDQLVQNFLQRFKMNPAQKIRNLSKGQCTKLALILALAPKPDLLVLDEPMSGLDPLAQHEFLQVISKDVVPEGRTVFFSTHNIADVEAVAHYVAIEYNGRIQISGSIPEVCQQVAKYRISSSHLEELKPFIHCVTLEQDDKWATILTSRHSHEEAAVTLENPETSPLPVSLKEAFLFFCSGGDEQ